MRTTLNDWIQGADKVRHWNQFLITDLPIELGVNRRRLDDLYIALVGQVLDQENPMRRPEDWAMLGNAFLNFLQEGLRAELTRLGINRNDAAFFAAASFYLGGFPSSATLCMRQCNRANLYNDSLACYELLVRPQEIHSPIVSRVQAALLESRLEALNAELNRAIAQMNSALSIGPEAWVSAHLLAKILERFSQTNLCAIFPDLGTGFWNHLIQSFVRRKNSMWDLFPSQIEAINGGVLHGDGTVSIQMPTSAGKTALSEAILYCNAMRSPDAAAVLLVPYRSLAAELRYGLVKHLNDMGISARSAYGGTIPTEEESHGFDRVQVLVSTPESLVGILSANPAFFEKVSLIICDEGHLLDSDSRGISLELLLARMKARVSGSPRFIFISAIVPNIEQISGWLGNGSVVRSSYRPAIAEFSVLRGTGRSSVNLELHSDVRGVAPFILPEFLTNSEFSYRSPRTGRINSYDFSSIKAKAIAAARKSLTMGGVVVFSANKSGNQGAVGLAAELVEQLACDLNLPNPLDFIGDNRVHAKSIHYLEAEYGAEWIGVNALRNGAILHHGDIPQESREVLEFLLRDGVVAFGICTSTLAEGVNLPIRTLVLYSVVRLGHEGARTNLKLRDIKNLVGRAGRAGVATRGLVICANEGQWNLVRDVLLGVNCEEVHGAMKAMVEHIQRIGLISPLTNEILEAESPHSVDGIDSILVDFANNAIDDDALRSLASGIAEHTFAYYQGDEASRRCLRQIIDLRASKVISVKSAGRLEWVRASGAKMRMINAVEARLLPIYSRLSLLEFINDDFVTCILEWVWGSDLFKNQVARSYHLNAGQSVEVVRERFFSLVKAWVGGIRFGEMVTTLIEEIDDILGIFSRLISFEMQVDVEQGLALLEKFIENQGAVFSPVLKRFPEHLRYGVSSEAGLALAANGIRHRFAYVSLGEAIDDIAADAPKSVAFDAAIRVINADRVSWRERLGDLVYERTCKDLNITI